ncbi:hypothetical protein D3C85_1791670 [compost metagenome]
MIQRVKVLRKIDFYRMAVILVPRRLSLSESPVARSASGGSHSCRLRITVQTGVVVAEQWLVESRDLLLSECRAFSLRFHLV